MSTAFALYQPGPVLDIPQMAAWEACTSCSGGPQPGATALMAYFRESVPGAINMGIYNCRNVAGSANRSVHSCGRACDLGCLVTRVAHRAMYKFLDALAPHMRRLGIQLVIFDRRYWSANTPPGGREYKGVHPHRDHIHIELNRAAARGLTLATLRSVVGDFRQWEEEMAGVTLGIQKACNAAGITDDDGNSLKPDDVWGPKTQQAADRWALMSIRAGLGIQRALNAAKIPDSRGRTLREDGVVGPLTEGAMATGWRQGGLTGGAVDLSTLLPALDERYVRSGARLQLGEVRLP